MRPDIAVVHEDRDLLVVVKPSGIATTAPDGGDCLTDRLERARGAKLHPSSRLDAEVTGLVTFAKTKRDIAALRQARAEGLSERGDIGIASAVPEPREGDWDASIGIDPREPRLRVALPPGASGQRVQHARTTYLTREVRSNAAVLWLTPHTGRTHQLRVHAAHAGAPLLGDQRYGGPKRAVLSDGRVISARRVMLHCAWLKLPAIDGGGALSLSAPVLDDTRELWTALGGTVEALRPEPIGLRHDAGGDNRS